MASPRQAPYIYVTWLTRLLAGEDQCQWKAWFKAHHQYTKAPSDFDLAAWTMNHNQLVHKCVDGLLAEGYEVFIEQQNKFNLRGKTGIRLSGQPDIVAIQSDQARVIDCKTGTEKHSDKLQVLVYMLILPLVRQVCKGLRIEGKVQYLTHSVPIPQSKLIGQFRSGFRELVHAVGGTNELRRVASYSECQFCDLTDRDCPDRIEEPPEVVSTDLF